MIEGGRGRAWLEIQMLPKSRETDRRYKISVCLLTLCHICFLFERGKRFSLLSKNVPWDHHLYFYIFHTVSWHRQNCVTLSMKPSLPIFSRFKMQVHKYLPGHAIWVTQEKEPEKALFPFTEKLSVLTHSPFLLFQLSQKEWKCWEAEVRFRGWFALYCYILYLALFPQIKCHSTKNQVI